MVRIEEFMVDNEIDDFYKDSNRFKGYKLIVDFDQIDLNFIPKGFNVGAPKMKQKQRSSIYVKPKDDKESLF